MQLRKMPLNSVRPDSIHEMFAMYIAYFATFVYHVLPPAMLLSELATSDILLAPITIHAFSAL